MNIVLIGASGSGKSTIERELVEKYGYEKIISYTTRCQREGEVDKKDYCFINNEIFEEMDYYDMFAEKEQYSQGRWYGTRKSDYESPGNKVAVLTPNGIRQLRHNMPDLPIFVVLVEANLGTRIKRYIDRIGSDKFTFDDKNEIAARVERDYGMFLGMDEYANLVVNNNENADINKIVEGIVNWVEKRK